MSIHLLTYQEHTGYNEPMIIDSLYSDILIETKYQKHFKKVYRGKVKKLPCYSIQRISEEVPSHSITSSYFIGVDWIETNKMAICINPKINTKAQKVDYLRMLLSAINHPGVVEHMDQLFHVKWNAPKIPIKQHQDFLTPFIILEFLGVLKQIVKKGLRKSYYPVEVNMQSRVKGKILVGKTIKQNLARNKQLFTYCKYEEFGFDTKENRFLKKALEFTKRYLPTYRTLMDTKGLQDLYNYISPAFEKVTANVEMRDLKQFKPNKFYKEYETALRLAKIILERFGYNMSATASESIETPPFWIDMSKLFEIYVLGLLKDTYQNQVKFQYKPDSSNEIDYLVNTENIKMVIDAKYKPRYITKRGKEEKDIRQVSGYARLKTVYKELYNNDLYDKIIQCLIIYPNQEKGIDTLMDENIHLKWEPINQYIDIYKLGVKLPVIKNHL